MVSFNLFALVFTVQLPIKSAELAAFQHSDARRKATQLTGDLAHLSAVLRRH